MGSKIMTTRLQVTPSTRAYMERKLACVAQKRSHVVTSADIARLLAEMQSPDEDTRAQAVRQVCPCRMPWEVFGQLRKAAQRLQHDPSPLVRAQALHVEEDARELEALEVLRERLAECDERLESAARRPWRRGKHRHRETR
jgi:hypothetical protein